jgi:hypothetical protein
MYGHEIVAEHHGTTDDGARYLGLLSLWSPYTGYEDTVGLRNSKLTALGIKNPAKIEFIPKGYPVFTDGRN